MRYQVKADHSISKRGKEGSAWKHLELALNACPNFPVLILPGMGLFLRMQWPWQRLFN